MDTTVQILLYTAVLIETFSSGAAMISNTTTEDIVTTLDSSVLITETTNSISKEMNFDDNRINFSQLVTTANPLFDQLLRVEEHLANQSNTLSGSFVTEVQLDNAENTTQVEYNQTIEERISLNNFSNLITSTEVIVKKTFTTNENISSFESETPQMTTSTTDFEGNVLISQLAETTPQVFSPSSQLDIVEITTSGSDVLQEATTTGPMDIFTKLHLPQVTSTISNPLQETISSVAESHATQLPSSVTVSDISKGISSTVTNQKETTLSAIPYISDVTTTESKINSTLGLDIPKTDLISEINQPKEFTTIAALLASFENSPTTKSSIFETISNTELYTSTGTVSITDSRASKETNSTIASAETAVELDTSAEITRTTKSQALSSKSHASEEIALTTESTVSNTEPHATVEIALITERHTSQEPELTTVASASAEMTSATTALYTSTETIPITESHAAVETALTTTERPVSAKMTPATIAETTSTTESHASAEITSTTEHIVASSTESYANSETTSPESRVLQHITSTIESQTHISTTSTSSKSTATTLPTQSGEWQETIAHTQSHTTLVNTLQSGTETVTQQETTQTSPIMQSITSEVTSVSSAISPQFIATSLATPIAKITSSDDNPEVTTTSSLELKHSTNDETTTQEGRTVESTTSSQNPDQFIISIASTMQIPSERETSATDSEFYTTTTQISFQEQTTPTTSQMTTAVTFNEYTSTVSNALETNEEITSIRVDLTTENNQSTSKQYNRISSDDLVDEELNGIITAIFVNPRINCENNCLETATLVFSDWLIKTVMESLGNKSTNWLDLATNDVIPLQELHIVFVWPTPSGIDDKLIFTFFVTTNMTIPATVLLPILVAESEGIPNILNSSSCSFFLGFSDTFREDADSELTVMITAIAGSAVAITLLVGAFCKKKRRRFTHCIIDGGGFQQDMQVSVEVGDINSESAIIQDEMQQKPKVKNGEITLDIDKKVWIPQVQPSPDVEDTKL